MLIAADDALKSAAEADRPRIVNKKFSKVNNLLRGFEKDFPLKDSTSNPNIVGTVTREAKMNDSEYAPMILHALKGNLHTEVRFLSVSLPLNAEES